MMSTEYVLLIQLRALILNTLIYALVSSRSSNQVHVCSLFTLTNNRRHGRQNPHRPNVCRRS